MGAALAAPGRRTVAITGDGGMMYHIAELETALRCDIPIVVVVLNNACLASEYHTQKNHGRLVPEVLDYRDVDFAAVARAFGAFGVRVEEADGLDRAIAQAFTAGKPALIDVRTSKEAQSPSANYDATRAV
jgi:acetolactate synthase I/II/III large subunit